MKQSVLPTSPVVHKWARGPIRGSGVLCVALVTMLVLLAPVAWGQDNATITGYVTDTSGALVPNANITLTNNATNQARETVSNSAGNYRFPNVGIGTYTMSVLAQGFQKYTKTGMVVNVAATLEADAVLTVGSPDSNCYRFCRRTPGADRNQRSQHPDQR